MTNIEQEILTNIKRYWPNKRRFGNTRISRRSTRLHILFVKSGGKEYPIFANAFDSAFWCDPYAGKSRLINSRLAMLKQEFSNAREISPEIMDRMAIVGRPNNYWATNNVFEVKTRNNRCRYFSTEKGAQKYLDATHGTLSKF